MNKDSFNEHDTIDTIDIMDTIDTIYTTDTIDTIDTILDSNYLNVEPTVSGVEIYPDNDILLASIPQIENGNTKAILDPKYKNLVMSGGSIRGISLIGAIKELIDKRLIDLKKLKTVTGTSAGSMLGTLIVLGLTIDEIWDFVYNFDVNKLVKPDPLLFFQKCGVETGQLIHNFFEDFITQKTGIKHINFRQLHELTGIHFTIVGTCLTTKEIIYFDHINTPHEKVSVALRISIGIPGFFIPFVIGDKKYIDGGVLNNYAMNLFDDRLDETIGIMICSDYNTDYKYPEEYFMAIINLLMYYFYQKTNEKYKNNTIYIKETSDNVFMVKFDIDYETKIKLYDYGVTAAKNFISNLTNIN